MIPTHALGCRLADRSSCASLFCALLLTSTSVSAQHVGWLREFGSADYDEASAVAADSTGIYVSGRARRGPYDLDAYLRKYDSSGNLVWERRIAFDVTSNEGAFDVALDAAGITVAGYVDCGGVCTSGAFARRFDKDGTTLWTHVFTHISVANSVVAHPSGIYVAGRRYGAQVGGPVIARLDYDGIERWVYAPAGRTNDWFSDITVGDDGIHGVGWLGLVDVQRLDLDGRELSPFGTGAIRGSAIAGDDTGLYVVSGDAIDHRIRKYSRAGMLLWDRALVMHADTVAVAGGGVYLSQQIDSGYAASIARYTADGNFVWQGEFGTSLSVDGLAVHEGRIYVSGAKFGATEADTDSFLVQYSPWRRPMARSLGTINGSPAVAVLIHDEATSSVVARVKDVRTGQLLNRIEFADSEHPQDLVVVPDLNGNGAAELALLGVDMTSGAVIAEVRDALSSAFLGSIAFDNNRTSRHFALVPDRSGGTMPGLVVLGDSLIDRSLRAEVNSAATGAAIQTVDFARNYYGEPYSQLAVLHDAIAGPDSSLAVAVFPTRDDYFATQHVPVAVKEAVSGHEVCEFVLDENHALLDMGGFPDLNGNGNAELGTLELGVVRRGIRVGIHDGGDCRLIRNIYFTKYDHAATLLALPDIDGNGVTDVGVLSVEVEPDSDLVEIKDQKTKAWLGAVRFPHAGFVQHGVIALPDLNDNGSPELAQLQQGESDQRLRLVIKDARTGALVRHVGF